MSKVLTEEVRAKLRAQYPGEDLVEIDGQVYHLEHTEEAWKSLRDKVRPGWGVVKENGGLEHYVIYNKENYARWLIDGVVCRNLTKDMEIPINCSSCYGMFRGLEIPDEFEFPEAFDTSEVVDMRDMFDKSKFLGDVCLGNGFKTDKVKTFRCMFKEAKISGVLDLGPNFSLENAEDVREMFYDSIIKKPIKFGDKFNPENASHLNSMFAKIIMPDGFNIGNNFHVREGACVREMFAHVMFNEDFLLPGCFNVDENNGWYLSIFDSAWFPRRVGWDDPWRSLNEIHKYVEDLKRW